MNSYVTILACFLAPLCCYGRTITVDDDGPADFRTIQAAMDAAADGDTVVVTEGRYTGPGNCDLDCLGKAIAVRSRYPQSSTCVQSTVIDAQGKGLIVRFVNGEGPESVFEGFTLVAGDTSVPVRGVPGFYEFSDTARPTIRNVRIAPAAGRESAEVYAGLTETLLSNEPYGRRLWDGNDPFSQPAATTDYHGSGDADNDGAVTPADPCVAQQMAFGIKTPSARADVDGDGDVDANDVSLINGALSSGLLPGWWNSLTTKEQRNAWITRFMAIDRTQQEPWQYWFQCLGFAVQLHIHGAFYGGELAHTFYDGSQTVFNLPVYHTSVAAPSFGHSVNAVLVGDDPLNFDDWRFIEPQTDYDIHPGMWDMPYGSTVRLNVPTSIGPGGFSSAADKVKFFVSQAGWTVQQYSPDLLLTRPSPPVRSPDNSTDLWNPVILPGRQDVTIFFERYRNDISRTTDIHLATFTSGGPRGALALTLSSQYSRLLDVCRDPGGTTHLLWKGKADHTPGVFYGRLDPGCGRVCDVTRVSEGVRMVRAGRIVVTGSGQLHVFWLEQKGNSQHPYGSGIYWTRRTEFGWQTAENIAPYADQLLDFSNWSARDLLRYYFDAGVLSSDGLVLVWAEPIFSTSNARLTARRYDGHWTDPQVIETTNARGVDLLADSEGTLHLVHWLGEQVANGSRGTLQYRWSLDGSIWSAPQMLDASGAASCPAMALGTANKVHLVWEKMLGSSVIPVLRTLQDGIWDAPRQLPTRSGADAWYPTVSTLADDSPIVAWSSRSLDHVTIETWPAPVLGDLDGSGQVDLSDFSVFARAWGSRPSDNNWNPQCDLAIPDDELVDWRDLAVFVDNWLAGQR